VIFTIYLAKLSFQQKPIPRTTKSPICAVLLSVLSRVLVFLIQHSVLVRSFRSPGIASCLVRFGLNGAFCLILQLLTTFPRILL